MDIEGPLLRLSLLNHFIVTGPTAKPCLLHFSCVSASLTTSQSQDQTPSPVCCHSDSLIVFTTTINSNKGPEHMIPNEMIEVTVCELLLATHMRTDWNLLRMESTRQVLSLIGLGRKVTRVNGPGRKMQVGQLSTSACETAVSSW